MADVKKLLLRLNTKSLAGAGTISTTPGAGRQLIFVDILASAATTISTQADGAGTVILYAPAGSTSLRAGIPAGINQPVFSSAGNVTVTYYIEDQNAITP